MTRVVHFGIVPRSQRRVDVLSEAARCLTDTPFLLGDSFTDWSEPYVQHRGDALHVTHRTESDFLDPEGDRIRLSREEVQEVADELTALLPLTLRLVDYWLEDDGDEYGSDVHLHGPWALASIAGQAL